MKINTEDLKFIVCKNWKNISYLKPKFGTELRKIVEESFGKGYEYPPSDTQGIIVVTYNGKPIATCTYKYSEIYFVCVADEYRGNGISKILVNKCILEMRKSGKGVIRISSRNPIAQKMYESIGFKEYWKTPYGIISYKIDMKGNIRR